MTTHPTKMDTVTAPRINTHYPVKDGLERWHKATDQLQVFSNAHGGATLYLRKGTDPQDIPSTIWPLDAAATQHLIALLKTACTPAT